MLLTKNILATKIYGEKTRWDDMGMEKDIIPKTDTFLFYNRVLVFLGIQMLFLRRNKERGAIPLRIIQSEEGAGVQEMP